MAQIELRLQSGTRSPGDLKVTVQDRTFDYLRTTVSPEIRVSAFLEQDAERVEAKYAEVFVTDDCAYDSIVEQVIPGSRERKVELPGPMRAGEQLTVIVKRKRRA